MTWQNRQALDWILAEKGGVCSLIGDYCCTYIPNKTVPEGSFSKAMTRLKKLRKEVKDNAGFGEDWFPWLEINLGKWGAALVKIGIAALICIAIMGMIFSRCIPILRSLVVSKLAKQMTIQSTVISVGTPDLFPISEWVPPKHPPVEDSDSGKGETDGLDKDYEGSIAMTQLV